eukprot:scaffold14859_cov66-Phaeocystis_antarctica.AAC.5
MPLVPWVAVENKRTRAAGRIAVKAFIGGAVRPAYLDGDTQRTQIEVFLIVGPEGRQQGTNTPGTTHEVRTHTHTDTHHCRTRCSAGSHRGAPQQRR